MLSRTLRREAQHGYTGILKTCHSLCHTSRADSNLSELISIGHRGYSHVGNHEHTILTILFLLRDEQQSTAHASNTWLTLNNLQGRTQGVTSCRECTTDLTVSTLGLDDHTAQVQRVLNQFTSLLNGHALRLADLCQFLCQFLALLVVLRINEGCLTDVGQSLLLGEGLNLCRITNQDDVCDIITKSLIGCTKGTLFFCFGEHDALLV